MSQSQQTSTLEEIDNFPDDFDWDEARLLGEDLHISYDEEDDGNPTQTQPATQPDQVLTDEQQRREQFRQFCYDRVLHKVPGWDVSSRLPWGKDNALVSLVDRLNISRRKASTWWLELRRSRGCLDDIEVIGTTESFKESYNSITKELVPSMCQHAWLVLEDRVQTMIEFRNNGDVKRDFNYLKESKEELNHLLCVRVLKYNSLLAEHIVGMSPSNKSSRLSSFEDKIWKTRTHSFLDVCLSNFPDFSHTLNGRQFFITLDMELFKKWNKDMNSHISTTLVTSVSENDVEDIICNSAGVLYYISGWLLHRILTTRGKTVSSFRLFVATNSLSSVSHELHSLPTGIADEREKHKGALQRVGRKFFHLITLIECLYQLNLRNKDCVWFYRDEIFVKICDASKRSSQVHDAFESCCHGDIPEQDRSLLLDFILVKYRNVRSKDFVRLLKRSEGGSDNIQFRQSVLVTHLMATGRTPSALRR